VVSSRRNNYKQGWLNPALGNVMKTTVSDQLADIARCKAFWLSSGELKGGFLLPDTKPKFEALPNGIGSLGGRNEGLVLAMGKLVEIVSDSEYGKRPRQE
jgi:hypothetical protein